MKNQMRILPFTLFVLLLSSFSGDEAPKKLILKGQFVDFKNNKPIGNQNYLYITDHANMFNKARNNTSGLGISENDGRFEVEVFLSNPDRSFEFQVGMSAAIKFTNPLLSDTINLEIIPIVHYNNELQLTQPKGSTSCNTFIEKTNGDSIQSILSYFENHPSNYQINPIDTIDIGSSQIENTDPVCWYNYKILSLSRDLSVK